MKKFIVLLSVICLMWSCESFLDQEPVGDRTDASYWKTSQDISDALAGAYRMWMTRNLDLMEACFDNQSDDHWRAGDHAADEDIETFNTNLTNTKIFVTYNEKYEVISRANNIIINAYKVKDLGVISDNAYNAFMGEAYFLRAYAYYRLLVIHGQVPIILEQNVLDYNYNVPKCESPDVLRDLIISDLEKAITLLPITYERGRANRGAAWALLVLAYMDKAENYTDAANLNKAIEYGENVIANYPLAENYESLFRTGNESNAELLFYARNDMEWINQSAMVKHRGPRPWGMYGFHQPLSDLVNEYEQDDIRKQVTIISNGDSIRRGALGWTIHTSALSFTGHNYRKFMSFRESDGWFLHGVNVPLIRAGYIYLRVAEAKIRLNGAGAGDFEINEIRDRADLQPVSNADISALIHETRCEEAGENTRYQNLLRWDKAGILDLEEFFASPQKMMDRDLGRRLWRRPKNYYQPLPQREIDNSGGVLVQNSLWVN